MKELSGALNLLLADFFALYLKTKNFHWHVSGPHFRDYHLLLDDQASEVFAVTHAVAERVRKIGGTTLRSIGHIARLQRVSDNDGEYVTPHGMLAELREDNARSSHVAILFAQFVDLPHARRELHACSRCGSTKPKSAFGFLFEAGRRGDAAV